MADLRPTTKARAKRIEIEYFKRWHPLRKTRFVLSIVAPAVAAVWLLAGAVQGDQRLYTSGPVSTAHGMWDRTCDECHKPTTMMGIPKPGGSYFLKTTNLACEQCHAGPAHHDNQVVPARLAEPGAALAQRCATCHVEHEGHVVLAALGPEHCTSCHDRLQVRGTPGAAEAIGPSKAFTPRLAGFSTGNPDADHPEFAVVTGDERGGRVRLDDKVPPKDPTQLFLNHKRHMKRGLDDFVKVKGRPGAVEINGELQLGCAFCHRTDASGAAVQPVRYQEHCADCHPISIGKLTRQAPPVKDDPQSAEKRVPVVAPHAEPALVRAFLKQFFADVSQQCRPPAPDAEAVKEKWCEQLGIATAAAPASRPAEAGRPASPEPAKPPEEGEGSGRRLMRPRSWLPPAPAPDAIGAVPPTAASWLRLVRLDAGSEPPVRVDARPAGSVRLARGETSEESGGGRRLLRGRPAEEPKAETPAETPSPRRLRRGGDDKEDTPASPAKETSAAAPRAAGGAEASRWAAEQASEAESKIAKDACGKCHVKDRAAAVEPAFKKTGMPGRWFGHSVFDHGAHRPVKCVECHKQAIESTDSADVMLPGIRVCRECHRAGGGARTTCVECHLYHDKTKERDMSGPFEVRQLTRRPAAPAAAAGTSTPAGGPATPAGGGSPGPSK